MSESLPTDVRTEQAEEMKRRWESLSELLLAASNLANNTQALYIALNAADGQGQLPSPARLEAHEAGVRAWMDALEDGWRRYYLAGEGRQRVR